MAPSLFEKARALLIIFFYGWVVSNAYNQDDLDVVYFLPLFFYAWSCCSNYSKKLVKQPIIKHLNETYFYNLDPDKHKNTRFYTELNNGLYTGLYSGLNTEFNTELYTGLYTGLNTELYNELYTELYTGLNTELNTGLNNELYTGLNTGLNTSGINKDTGLYNFYKKFVSSVKKCIAKIFSVSFMIIILLLSTVKKCIAKIFSVSFMIIILEITGIILLLSNIPYVIAHDCMCTGEDYIL